jgi:excisionase family DNA binding protein
MEPEEPEQSRREEEVEPALERWRARRRPQVANAGTGGRIREETIERPRTVNEAAEELGLSVHTVRAWVASRRLGYLRLGRAIRIPAAEIRRILEQCAVPALKEE